VVFGINNNQWAISMPRAAQTAAETLAQKAVAAGFPGEQVDGNDVIAVRDAAARALEKARSGGGAHLIEALTYRLSDHTTADDASRYRDDELVGRQWKEDPIARLRVYLTEDAGWTAKDEEALITECGAAVEAASEAYLATPPPEAGAMFDFTYHTLPDDLARQRETQAEAEND